MRKLDHYDVWNFVSAHKEWMGLTLWAPIHKMVKHTQTIRRQTPKDLQAYNFIKKRFQHRCFGVNIGKFLITPILKNVCEQLLLNSVNG